MIENIASLTILSLNNNKDTKDCLSIIKDKNKKFNGIITFQDEYKFKQIGVLINKDFLNIDLPQLKINTNLTLQYKVGNHISKIKKLDCLSIKEMLNLI